MVPGVVVAKNQDFRGGHVLVGVHQPVEGQLCIDGFAKVQDRAIDKIEFAAYEAFVGTSLVIGNVRRSENTAGGKSVPDLLEIAFNPQIGSLVPSRPFRATVPAVGVPRSIRQIRGSRGIRHSRSAPRTLLCSSGVSARIR